MIEFNYQAYQVRYSKYYRELEISVNQKIDFKKMMMFEYDEFDNIVNECKVDRSTDTKRRNPKQWQRHDTNELTMMRELSTIYYLHDQDLEWLSLNWRKYRASKMSKSIRRMILIMFEEDYQYFPTLKEIKEGLIKYQICQIQLEA